jgi:hypothetical protein
MGADGGVSWVKTSDAKRLFDLIRPFGFWSSLNDGYEEYHDAYLAKDPLPPGFVVLPYGTNHDLQGFLDVRDMLLECEDEVLSLSQYGDDPTFIDVLLDILTRPLYEARQRPQNTFESALFKVFHLSFYDLQDPKLRVARQDKIMREASEEPMFSVTLKSWCQEVLKVIEIKTIGSAETWT